MPTKVRTDRMSIKPLSELTSLPKSPSREELESQVVNSAPSLASFIKEESPRQTSHTNHLGVDTPAHSGTAAAVKALENLTKQLQMTQSVEAAILNLRHETISISKMICEITDNEGGSESWGEAKNITVEFGPHHIKVWGDGKGYKSIERLLESHQRGNKDKSIHRTSPTDVKKTGKFCEGKFSQFAIVDKRTEVTKINDEYIICKCDVEIMKTKNNFSPTVMPRLATDSELKELNVDPSARFGTAIILERFLREYNPEEQYKKFCLLAPHLYNSLGCDNFKSITVTCGSDTTSFNKFSDFTQYEQTEDNHKFEGTIDLYITKHGERYSVSYAEVFHKNKKTPKKFGDKPLGKFDKFSLPFKFAVNPKGASGEIGWKFRRNGRNLNIENSHRFGAEGGMYRGKGCRGEINFEVSPILDIIMGVTPLKDIPTS